MWHRLARTSARIAASSAQQSTSAARLHRRQFPCRAGTSCRALSSRRGNEAVDASFKNETQRPGKRQSRPTQDPSHATLAASERAHTKVKTVLNKFMSRLNRIQHRLFQECKPLPPIWEEASESGDVEKREALFRETKQVLDELRDYVDFKGSLFLTHTHELTVLFERILEIYAHSASSKEHSTINYYDETKSLLRLMKAWNLDVQQKHCDYAIQVAARQGQWKGAADLFWRQIDPDRSGYIPMDANPVGLYVVARAAQESGEAPLETTLEAVLRMSMVSPSDQDEYIYAAGIALGLVGEASALLDCLKRSEMASQMGQSLVAAAMKACMLCDRPDDAVHAFDDFIGRDLAIADEWQWGGGQDRLHPRCRNLAIQALACSHELETSKRAYQLYREANDCGDGVSLEALKALFAAFEKEGRWKDALALFFRLLDLPLDVPLSADDAGRDALTPQNDYLLCILETVMRCCNASEQFGSAILACRLHQLATHAAGDTSDVDQDTGNALARLVEQSLLSFGNRSNLFAVFFASLAGLGVQPRSDERIAALSSDSVAVSEVFVRHANSLNQQSSFNSASVESVSWEACYNDIHRVTAAAHFKKHLDLDNSSLFSQAAGNAIHACNMASQPELGLQLALWLRISISAPPMEDFIVEPLASKGSFVITDRLLASIMSSYRRLGNEVYALNLFESYANGMGEPSAVPWLLSSVEAIALLFTLSRQREAMDLFQSISTKHRSPDLFRVTFRGLVDIDRPVEALELYRLALSSGCLSDDLTVAAMHAVENEHEIMAKYGLLKSMVKEVSKLTGCRPATWLEARYWQLKSLIGGPRLNFLMGWRDPNSYRLDELEYALKMLESRSALGLVPQEDGVRLIVRRAREYRLDNVIADKTGIDRVPRDKLAWAATVDKAVQAAQNSSLRTDESFIKDVADAYFALDCREEYDNLILSAHQKGLLLDDMGWRSGEGR